MRKLILFLLVFVSAKVSAQVYQEMPQYGYRANRMAFDSTLQIPTVCGAPTLKSIVKANKNGAIAYDSCNAVFYTYNPKTQTWSAVSGGGGGATDTTSLSNRINLKLNIADTSAMLNPYLRKIDTTNKFVSSVTSLNDSTIRVIKGTSTTDIIIKSVSNATNAQRLSTTVYNNSGVTITKGTVVYINGRHSSNFATILPAQANSENNSYKTFAIVNENIADQSTGLVIQAGNITGLNLPTSTFTDGDIVYLSPTVAGGITNVKPLAPNHICKLGSVTRAHPTLGAIEIKIENGWQLDELSDVQVSAVPNDSTLLQFSRVDSLWHDVSVINAIGTNYLKPIDSVSLSNRINLKLNIADTSSMLSKYLRKTDTATLSNRINLKLNISDTSNLQSKSISSYSIFANNTSGTANVTAQQFRDTSGVYSGTITWTGTTAPSGATTHTYKLTQIGKCVTIHIALVYATNGAGLTAVQMTLPSGAPTPAQPTGLTGSIYNMYPIKCELVNTSNQAILASSARGFLRNNTGANGYEIYITFSTAAPGQVGVIAQYWTN